MTPTELMIRVTSVLQAMGIRYAVTGSMASTFYGEMRTTNDVDIVADLPARLVPELIKQFPSDEFYISEKAILWAIEHRSQFNIIHPDSGLKADVIISGDSPHDHAQLDRAIKTTQQSDAEVAFAAPEDVILKKLWFYKLGDSDKHLRDIAGMLKISHERIDRNYIREWTVKLGLEELWDEIAKRVP